MNFRAKNSSQIEAFFICLQTKKNPGTTEKMSCLSLTSLNPSRRNLGGLTASKTYSWRLILKMKLTLWLIGKCEKLQHVKKVYRTMFSGYYSNTQIQYFVILSTRPQIRFITQWSADISDSVEPLQNRLSEKMVHRHFQTAHLCTTKFSNFLGRDAF